MTHTRSDVLALLQANGLRPSRALGQNYVADPNTVRRIARLAEVGPGDSVVEVGGGLGSLTLALAETGASVTVLEIDRFSLPILREVTADKDVTVLDADATTVNWNSVAAPDRSHTMVANLPYNVGTSIVADILDFAPQITRMVVMVQKEVAQRLVANAGDDAYGALSVKVRFHSVPKMLGYVPPTVFIPQPEVDSALVRFTRLANPALPDVDPAQLFTLVKAGFSQRRKMLRKVLSGMVTAEMFECAGVAPTARAEELDVQAWGRLTKCQTASKTPTSGPTPS